MTPDGSDVFYGTLGLMVIKTLERFLKISENPS
jgi:hypothetical protein